MLFTAVKSFITQTPDEVCKLNKISETKNWIIYFSKIIIHFCWGTCDSIFDSAHDSRMALREWGSNYTHVAVLKTLLDHLLTQQGSKLVCLAQADISIQLEY